MANPLADYPTAVHTATDVSAFGSSKLGSTTPTHTNLEGKQEEEIAALQTKVGIGSSTPETDGHVLTVQADGSTAWEALPAAAAGDMKADGSVDFTAVVSYNTDKTFTTDQDIVSKKYVDDAIVLAGGYTDEQAQDAVGGMLTDSSSIDFTYTDASATITAAVLPAGVDHDSLNNFVANEHIDWTSDQGATNIHSGNIPDLSATYKAVGADETANVGAASTTAAGKIEVAIASEVNTGTSTSLAVSPDALAGSNFGIRYQGVNCFDYTTNVAIGDGKGYLHIPPGMNGMNLVYAHAQVISAGTTGTTDIQIHNVTDSQDMLSTKLTIDSGETGSNTAATAAVINASYDDVATNDLLRIDVDAISTTAPKGLLVTLGFQLP